MVLVNALGISRAMLRTTLDALMNADLVMRNPGYGHPLRPEYVLTDKGRRLAPLCGRFEELVDELDIAVLAHRKWSAPLLLAVRRGNNRFNLIAGALPGISPRALTTALRALTEHGLLERGVDDGYPPVSAYTVTRTGRRVAATVAQMVGALDES